MNYEDYESRVGDIFKMPCQKWYTRLYGNRVDKYYDKMEYDLYWAIYDITITLCLLKKEKWSEMALHSTA